MRPPIDFEHVCSVMDNLQVWLNTHRRPGCMVPQVRVTFDPSNWLVMKIDQVEVWNQESALIERLCFDNCRNEYMEHIASLTGLFAEYQAEQIGKAACTVDDINQAISLLQRQLQTACAKSTTTWTLQIAADVATLSDGDGIRWFGEAIATHFKYFDELPGAQSPACAVPRDTLERVLALRELTDTDSRRIQAALNNAQG